MRRLRKPKPPRLLEISVIGFIYIAAGGPEAVFWIIVVIIAAIAQIVKASKKMSQPGPNAGSFGDGATPPDEELQKFLESLTGTKPPPPPRPVTTPPLPPRSTSRPVPPVPVRSRHVSTVTSRTVTNTTQMSTLVQSRQEITARKPSSPARRSSPPVPPPAQPVRRKAPTPKPAATADAYDLLAKSSAHTQRASLRAELGDDLVSRNSLRKAILLADILGRPVAMRDSRSMG